MSANKTKQQKKAHKLKSLKNIRIIHLRRQNCLHRVKNHQLIIDVFSAL